MTDLHRWLATPLFGNSLGDWLVAIGAALFAWLAVAALVIVGRRRLRKIESRGHEPSGGKRRWPLRLLAATRLWLAAVVALALAAESLRLPAPWPHRLEAFGKIALVAQLALWLQLAAEVAIARLVEGGSGGAEVGRRSAQGLLLVGARAIIWAVAGMAVLALLGVDVTAFVAGLGIGGVAIALAVQNILSDVFASVSIIVDRPFEVGDTINFGTLTGTVERIGIKSTRLRSVEGEEVILPNSVLLGDRIRNFARMQERRVVSRLGLSYETSPEAMRRVPELLREVVEAVPRARFSRAHFAGYGDFALFVELVYLVDSSDYDLFVQAQHEIHLRILAAFAGAGLAFAYPTQTVFLRGAAASPGGLGVSS